MAFYFVRVNGETGHNNPSQPDAYVPGEPPTHPQRYFNYLQFCFERDIVRIGWPDTGDLSSPGAMGKLADAYSLETVAPHVRAYLERFRAIAKRSIVLVPDRDRSGDIYIGRVTGTYHYCHSVPLEPYECAHRLGVSWDRHPDGSPVLYRAGDLNISNRGGFWMRAFHVLDESPSGRAAIPFIEAARQSRQ